jgi:hypothetical protein
MAFPDPTTMTNTAIAVVLNKLGNGANGTNVLASTDGNDELTLRHTRTKNGRLINNAQYKRTKLVSDPYLTGVSRDQNCMVNITVNSDKGITVAERKENVLALVNALTASSNALLLKLLGFEL